MQKTARMAKLGRCSYWGCGKYDRQEVLHCWEDGDHKDNEDAESLGGADGEQEGNDMC